MQTFLPYPDFQKSSECLDYRRLGKQRVEAFQIINVLEKTKQGIQVAWRNHPAVLMWQGYENALKVYINTCINTWIDKGYKNSMLTYNVKEFEYPWWFNGEIHATHRSNLIRKDKQFYGQYGWKENAELEYYWPVKKEII